MKKAIFILLLFVLCSLTSIAQNVTKKPKKAKKTKAEKIVVPPNFKSDGCTLFPDGNYRECCVAHDKDYYVGGSAKERKASDKRLYRCVKGKKGWQNKILAPIMYIGVRVFGTSALPTYFRWGFGKDRIKKKKKINKKRKKKKKKFQKLKVRKKKI